MLFVFYRKSNLSFDWPAINLFTQACPLLGAKLSISHPMLANTRLAWLVVLETGTNTVLDNSYSYNTVLFVEEVAQSFTEVS
jgi:hypothetical protein